MPYYDYTGVIHLHSVFSFDGHVGMDKIIKAAAINGLDFIMLTDHGHLRARDEGWQGWQGNVLVIVGEEISPRFNHYLAFNIDQPVENPEDETGIVPQRYIDAVNKAGGFGFIAHPDHEGTKKFHVKHYPWTDWSVDGYTGMSIWDFMTDWQSGLKRYWPSLIKFFWPAFFLQGPRQITLARWDSLNQKKKVVGIGELDNHGSSKKIGGLKIAVFPFQRAFKFISTHICTKEPLNGNSAQDITALFAALRHGRCYAAMEYFKAARGFHFLITQKNEEYSMGDSLVLDGQAHLSIALPAPALVRIIRNGTLWREEVNKNMLLVIEKEGVYRAEVYLKAYGKYRPWIFSNPIFVSQ